MASVIVITCYDIHNKWFVSDMESKLLNMQKLFMSFMKLYTWVVIWFKVYDSPHDADSIWNDNFVELVHICLYFNAPVRSLIHGTFWQELEMRGASFLGLNGLRTLKLYTFLWPLLLCSLNLPEQFYPVYCHSRSKWSGCTFFSR